MKAILIIVTVLSLLSMRAQSLVSLPELQVLYTNYDNKITILNAEADSLILEGYTQEKITKQGNLKYVEFNIRVSRGDSLWDENYDYKTGKFTLHGTFYKGGKVLNKEKWEFKIKELPWPEVFTINVSKTVGAKLICVSPYDCPLDLSFSIVHWNIPASFGGKGDVIPSSAVEKFKIGQTIMVFITLRDNLSGRIHASTRKITIVP